MKDVLRLISNSIFIECKITFPREVKWLNCVQFLGECPQINGDFKSSGYFCDFHNWTHWCRSLDLFLDFTPLPLELASLDFSSVSRFFFASSKHFAIIITLSALGFFLIWFSISFFVVVSCPILFSESSGWPRFLFSPRFIASEYGMHVCVGYNSGWLQLE